MLQVIDATTPKHDLSWEKLVGAEGFEPSRLATADFKSAVSAIPPRPQRMRVRKALAALNFSRFMPALCNATL